MMFKKTKKAMISALVCWGMFTSGGQAFAADKKFTSESVIAKIGDHEMTFADYQKIVKELGIPQADTVQEMVLDQMIEQEVVALQARKEKLDQSPEVQQRFALMQDIILRDAYLNHYVEKNLTDNMVKAEHEKRIKDFVPPMEYHASHILVEKEADIQKIYKELKADKTQFKKLAADYSKDSNAKQGGDLGFFMAEMMVKPFADTVKKLAINEISEPVKTDFGWHVIMLQEKRQKTIPPFEKVKGKLRSEMAQTMIEKQLETLKKEVSVQKFLK